MITNISKKKYNYLVVQEKDFSQIDHGENSRFELVEFFSENNNLKKMELLQHILKILQKLGHSKIEILQNISAPQPSTMMVKKIGLWGLLKRQGVNLQHFKHLKNLTVSKHDNLILYGVAEIGTNGIVDYIDLASIESNSYLYVSNKKDPFPDQKLESLEWNYFKDGGKLKEFTKDGGVILQLFGKFDDPDAGVSVISQKEVIQKIVNGL